MSIIDSAKWIQVGREEETKNENHSIVSQGKAGTHINLEVISDKTLHSTVLVHFLTMLSITFTHLNIA